MEVKAVSNDAPWNHDLDEHEYPDEDQFDEDRDDTMPCPSCGAEIYDDAVQCPVCGEYVTADTSPWSGRPTWWILLGVAGVAAVIVVLALLS